MSKEATIETVRLSVPVGRVRPGEHLQTHFELQLSLTEASAIAALRAALRDQPQRLLPQVPGETGRVANHDRGSDVLRFLIQRLAQSIAEMKV